MSWTTQGFNAQGFNPVLGSYSDYWHVESNGDELPEVEACHMKKVELNGWRERVKIVYGMSRNEFFRGLVLTDDINKTNDILKCFDGFSVYRLKYGLEKKFNSQGMTVLVVLGVCVFFETKAEKFTGEKILLTDIINQLMDELKYGIELGYINDQQKSLEEIRSELKAQIF